MANKKGSSNTAYYGIIGGNFTRKIKSPTDDDKKRKDVVSKENFNTGEKTWHEAYFSIDGKLESIAVRQQGEKDYDDMVVFRINTDEGVDQFSIGLTSGRFIDLAGRLANTNLNGHLEFSPWFIDEEKKRSGIALKDNNGKVAKKYNKEFSETSNMPPWKETSYKGKPQWDNYDQVIWILHELCKQAKAQGFEDLSVDSKFAPEGWVNPIGSAASNNEPIRDEPSSQKDNSAGSVSDAEEVSEDDDDLPF